MALTKLTDSDAKKVLGRWPTRTNIWPAPRGKGYWMKGQPKSGKWPGPVLTSPGAKLFRTQPDGLWIYFDDTTSCDVVVVEICGTIQNLNDKRSRYIPASHSIVLSCTAKWLCEEITIQKQGKRPRWEACRSIKNKPTDDLVVPVRHLRVLYGIPNILYHQWCREHTPTGYEYFSPHSSFDTFTSQTMQDFLRQMSSASHFRTKVKQV